MAQNNRGSRPSRRKQAPELGDDTGSGERRERYSSQGSPETREEQAAHVTLQPPAIEEPHEQSGAVSEELVTPAIFAGEAPEIPAVAAGEVGRRERHRASQNNALGMLIEQHFEEPTAPCRSYSDLERRSRISREALSRYVTTRPDRRRSPTIDSLVAIADAMHLSLESVARAAAAAAKGIVPPSEDVQQRREDLVRTRIAALSDEQFSAVVELLIQMRPLGPGSSGSRRLIPQL